MRFSVLLPTRNGGAFLANCIRSVLEQDHGDFELVISDNANSDATPQIIREFAGDPRVKALRQAQPIPVSENWTATLDASGGDYVLMMGDDDYLLPGALARLDAALQRHGEPDCVIYNGYSYVTPGSIAGNPASFWAREHFSYGPDFGGEGVLDRAHRMDIVRDMFRLRQRIPLNMQTTVFARRAAAQVRGGVFPAPFPDHYLLNALLIAADRWVYLPERLVIVGVSPKSFGHYYYSQKGNDGLAYLGVDTGFPGALPGNELLNGMCAWLLRLKRHYAQELAGIEIDRPGYVRRQVQSWILQYRYGGLDGRGLASRVRLLTGADWGHLLTAGLDSENWRRVFRALGARREKQVQTLWTGLQPLDGVTNVREFAAWLLQHPEQT